MFPFNKETFTRVTNDTQVYDEHPNLHNQIAETLEELQDRVGITGSTDPNSFSFRIDSLEGDRVKITDFNEYFDIRLAYKTTDNLSEGSTNLYYTDARFDNRFGTKTTDDLIQGSINKYYDESLFNVSLSNKTTDNLNEGSVNLYYTDNRVSANSDVVTAYTHALITLANPHATSLNQLSNVHIDSIFTNQGLIWDGNEWVNSTLGYGDVISLATSATSGDIAVFCANNPKCINNSGHKLSEYQTVLTFGDLTDIGTDGITITGGTGSIIGTGVSLSQHIADSTHNGYLSSTDWGTFNGKQNALGFTPENIVNKVTSLSGSSTDVQYPSAKLVYDQLVLKENYIDNSGITDPNSKFLNANKQFTEIVIGSGGYAANVYATDDASTTVPAYKKLSYTPSATQVERTAIVNNNEVLIATSLFDADIGITTIDAGVWTAIFQAKVSNSTGTTKLRVEVFARHTDNTETTLFSVSSNDIDNTTYSRVVLESAQPIYTVVATDKLGVRTYASTTRTTNTTVNYYVGDGEGWFIRTPIALRHSQLRDRDVSDCHPASAITNTPAGNISSTTVQAAINELDTEKLAISSKASGSEIDTGTDNDKYVTAKAIADSKLSYIDGSETLTNKTLTSPIIDVIKPSVDGNASTVITKADGTTAIAEFGGNGDSRILMRNLISTESARFLAYSDTNAIESAIWGSASAYPNLARFGSLTNADVSFICNNTEYARMTTRGGGGFIPRLYSPQGFLINGKIVRTVDGSGNMTVAIKTISGNDPSATDPVYVRIGNTVRSITSALSVTKNAGVNSHNAGSAELATKEIDYFVYLTWNTAYNTVDIGFSRIPSGILPTDFSYSEISEKYLVSNYGDGFSGIELIGRFNATLSAGPTYTWSIPATDIIINRPIFETRWLDYTAVYSNLGSMTVAEVAAVNAYGNISKYKIISNVLKIQYGHVLTYGGTLGTAFTISLPMSSSILGQVTLNARFQNKLGRADFSTSSTDNHISLSAYDQSTASSGNNWASFNGDIPLV